MHRRYTLAGSYYATSRTSAPAR
eukprot:COSAG02_NODE_7450_length_3008_cov_1.793056_5_plen_22_part_01